MSLREVEQAFERLRDDDELLEAQGFCRRSAEVIFQALSAANQTHPLVEVMRVVWPQAHASEEVHYAVRVVGEGKALIFNPSATPLFPQYNGDLLQAPGLLSQMVPTDEIK